MTKRPTSITVLSWLFIVVGLLTCYASLDQIYRRYGPLPLNGSPFVVHFAMRSDEHPLEIWLILATRIVLVVSGTFMLYGFSWARWLTVVWMGFHLLQSFLHTPLELTFDVLTYIHTPWELWAHIHLFAVILYIVFRPEAGRYFRGARAVPQIPKPEDTGMAE